MSFVKNCWYVCAWDSEVTNVKPLGRLIAGESIVLFRTDKNEVAALEDRCAHRRLPLSLGRIKGDGSLVCGYHGLAYNSEGKCVDVPGQSGKSSISVRSYPVKEKNGLIWVWLGEVEKGRDVALPDCSWLDRPDWKQTRLYRNPKANYLLLNDNLADLLHVAYLHIPSGGGNEFMGPADTDLVVTGNAYHFRRETKDIPCPPGYGRLSNVKGNVDRWHIVDFEGPSFFRIYTGVAAAGTGGPDSKLPSGNGRWAIAPHHFVTPESETSLHYFQIVGHEWAPSSDTWAFLNNVINEDVWAIEHQQSALCEEDSSPMKSIPSDAAMNAMRKIVNKMISNEGR